MDDVKEILSAITKEDFEKYQDLAKASILEESFIDDMVPEIYNFDSKQSESDAIRILKDINRVCLKLAEKNYENFNIFLSRALILQMRVVSYHQCENSEMLNNEIQRLICEKAAKEYDSPKSGKILEDLPKVSRALPPENLVLLTYKLVDTLFTGQLPVGIEKKVNMTSEKDKRKGKVAYTLLMLNFDELGDGITISRNLSLYDQQVWNACVNLILNDYTIITPAQIYKWMGYKGTIGKTDKEKIMESVNTIIRARVSINNEYERKLYKRYPKISIDSPLLAAKIITARSGKNEVTAIKILEMPDLYTVAEERGQITTVPFALLEVPMSKTDSDLQLSSYLQRRIIHMKHDSETSRKILLSAVREKCCIGLNRMQKARLPEKLKRILTHYKEIGWIIGYQLTDSEIEIKIPVKK